jgi:hypothetical protein
MATKFYVIERRYVGPNAQQNWDQDRIYISNEPGSGDTFNDWAEYHRGEYESEDEARAAIETQFGECRELDNELDESLVAVFAQGLYAPFNDGEMCDWLRGYLDDVTPDTSDEEIDAWLQSTEDAANADHNASLWAAYSDNPILHNRRQELENIREAITAETTDDELMQIFAEEVPQLRYCSDSHIAKKPAFVAAQAHRDALRAAAEAE